MTNESEGGKAVLNGHGSRLKIRKDRRLRTRKPLPCASCGGKCCTYAPIEKAVWDKVKNLVGEDGVVFPMWEGTRKEAYLVVKKTVGIDPAINLTRDGECYFLNGGRCSIYSRRPFSCRAMGTEVNPCPVVDPEGARRAVESFNLRQGPR